MVSSLVSFIFKILAVLKIQLNFSLPLINSILVILQKETGMINFSSKTWVNSYLQGSQFIIQVNVPAMLAIEVIVLPIITFIDSTNFTTIFTIATGPLTLLTA